jgi:outer membrane protein OmpA-like peptidoglycan-associated protein
MWFTRCPVLEKTNIGCEIWVAEKKGRSWGEPTKIELKDSDSTHVGHPCVNPDGNLLIFSSNMAGGYGGTDLWYVTYDRRNDEWSLPENLGPQINSPGNEAFPTWGPEGELFYASDGMVGLGGLDIYKASRVGEENKWEKPVNLGAPLNSCRDDYHIIYTEHGKIERGYISSNRNGSKGDHSQDIWDFYLPPVLVDVMILVSDQETGVPIPGAKVNLIGSDGSNYNLTTDASGQINLSEKANGDRYVEPGYTWTIEVEGQEAIYLPGHDAFSSVTEVNTRIIRDIKVLNIKKPIRLPEIRYDLGKASLQVNDSVNSKDSLNYLYDLMIENPNIVVELMAHTDCRGSNAANKTLSQRRADSCVYYLVVEKGLAAERLVPAGYGEEQPLEYTEVSAEGDSTTMVLKCDYINKFKRSDKAKFEHYHQLNRRTECRILSMDYVAPEPEENPSPEGGDN